MSITATVENGLIKLSEGLDLPNGTKVTILTAPAPEPGSFAERFARFAGMADDVPEDLAEQVDHYVHGLPKR